MKVFESCQITNAKALKTVSWKNGPNRFEKWKLLVKTI